MNLNQDIPSYVPDTILDQSFTNTESVGTQKSIKNYNQTTELITKESILPNLVEENVRFC